VRDRFVSLPAVELGHFVAGFACHTSRKDWRLKEHVMQVRLSRSSSERMVAGVCGGLAEYFNIDPVIVRLIFVLVTLTSGLGLLIYLLLWMIMPRGAAVPGQRPIEQSSRQFNEEISQLGQQLSQEATQLGQQLSQEASRLREKMLSGQRTVGVGDPPEYRSDPFVGQSLGQEQPVTEKTVNLGPLPGDLPTPYVQPVPSRPRSWNKLGVILIGIGGLIFLEQLGIDLSLIFPALMIAAGLILMSRRR